MENQAQVVMERMFRALERRDKADFMACVAADAVFFDPHYPKPEMHGRAAIDSGIDWGLSMMKRFGFRTVRFFPGDDGMSGVFEIDTNHELKTGQKLSFPQIFVVDTKDGLVTKLRAYEPYGPNGIGGFFLGLERLKQRLFG